MYSLLSLRLELSFFIYNSRLHMAVFIRFKKSDH